MVARGKMCVLEGIDGVGKTTLAKRLVDRVPSSCYVSFPQRASSSGKRLDAYLNGGDDGSMSDEEAHLLFIENRKEFYEIIDGVLNSGVNIFCDRFWMSGCAYSIARGLSLDWCWKTESDYTRNLPDLTVLIDRNEAALRNKAKRSTEDVKVTEKGDFLRKVAEAYNRLMVFEKNKQGPDKMRVTVKIDANSLSEDETLERLISLFKSRKTSNAESSVQLITGPMFAGKTTELIQRCNVYAEAGKSCIILRPDMDTRGRKRELNTHSASSVSVHHNVIIETVDGHCSERILKAAKGYDVVGFDEGQFFTMLKEAIQTLTSEDSVIVIVAALNGTYDRKTWPSVGKILSLCTEIMMKKSVCAKCGEWRATLSNKLEPIKSENTVIDQVDVGGDTKYIAICMSCSR